MRKYWLLILLAIFIPTTKASAFCPACTVAAAGGLGLARYFGIDDVVSSLWLGGVTVAVSIWTFEWLEKKKWIFPYHRAITTIAYYALLVAPLYFYDLIGHPLNKFWGVDKILLGVIIGSIFFYGAGYLYQWMKKKNGGKAHFPFEKVVLPISTMIILSIIFYFLTK